MVSHEEVFASIHDARDTVKAGDAAVRSSARLCIGRLQLAEVGPEILASLKRELMDFNIRTKEWKG